MSLVVQYLASGFHENTMFFTSMDFPALHVKQCYLIANAMKNNKFLTPEMKKLIIRDVYNPSMTPFKTTGDLKLLINNRQLYTEASIILNKYIQLDPTFGDLYLHGVVKPQLPISAMVKYICQDSNYVNEYRMYE